LEVPVTDMEKAKNFYGKAFGWEGKMQDFSEEYTLVHDPDNSTSPSFGLFKAESISKSQVRITLGVEDISRALKVIEEAGGKMTREKYEISPEIGHAAEFEDPFGNNWALFTAPTK